MSRTDSVAILYLDELLLKLEYTGIGCFWNSHYAGALANADDTVL